MFLPRNIAEISSLLTISRNQVPEPGPLFFENRTFGFFISFQRSQKRHLQANEYHSRLFEHRRSQ